jgi:phage major head subunit gpT-like protein
VAAVIKQETGLDTELVEGGRGEFTIWVGDKVVAQKDAHGFPSEKDAVAAVKERLGKEKAL